MHLNYSYFNFSTLTRYTQQLILH